MRGDELPEGSGASDGPDEPESGPGFGRRQVIATIITLAVLVLVFVVVLPQFADYSQAWEAIQAMSVGWIVTLVVATVVVIGVYVLPYQAALPGLTYGPGFVVRQTSFMISNAIPAGGAVGLGVQFSMLSSYGFAPAASTAAIGITGVWNTFITLALPVFGLVALLALGDGQASAVLAAGLGLLAVGVGIGLFAVILRSEDRARQIGAWADRAVSGFMGRFHRDVTLGLAEKLVEFRDSIVGVVSDRWVAVTVTNLGQQLSQFLVLYLAVVAITGGNGATVFAQTFVAFSFARLATFIPIPPGGLGTTDAILVSILTGFGISSNDALAASLVWRAATYFPQILIGVGTFLYWRRQSTKSRSAQAST